MAIARLSKSRGGNPLVGSSPTPSANMFNFFKKQEEPKKLADLLFRFRRLKEDFDRISRELEKLKSEGKFSIQKVGLVRFNPFKEIGGNQSFSLALLDGNDCGIVISSLYSSQENRFYGKTIKNGKSEYSLSKEEKEAIKMAQERSLYKKNEKNDEKNNKRKFDNSAAGSGGLGAY